MKFFILLLLVLAIGIINQILCNSKLKYSIPKYKNGKIIK